MKTSKEKQRRIRSLIHTSVQDCKTSIALVSDVELLQAVLDKMEQDGIESKSRRQVIERRIRAIKK
jgi:hypothetical protein